MLIMYMKWAIVQIKIEKSKEILGYDNFPYLIILDLNVRLATTFRAFKVEDN